MTQPYSPKESIRLQEGIRKHQPRGKQITTLPSQALHIILLDSACAVLRFTWRFTRRTTTSSCAFFHSFLMAALSDTSACLFLTADPLRWLLQAVDLGPFSQRRSRHSDESRMYSLSGSRGVIYLWLLGGFRTSRFLCCVASVLFFFSSRFRSTLSLGIDESQQNNLFQWLIKIICSL